MGEDERCAGDVADFPGAGRDVAEGAPSVDEQGEPSFPRQRRERWIALRVRALISSSRPPVGCLTGIRMPMPAP